MPVLPQIPQMMVRIDQGDGVGSVIPGRELSSCGALRKTEPAYWKTASAVMLAGTADILYVYLSWISYTRV
jgi:hypothetical protein